MKNFIFTTYIYLIAVFACISCSEDDSFKDIIIEKQNVDTDIIRISWSQVAATKFYELKFYENETELVFSIELEDKLSFEKKLLKASTNYKIIITAVKLFDNEKVAGKGDIVIRTGKLPETLVGKWETKLKDYTINLNTNGTGNYFINNKVQTFIWKIQEINNDYSSGIICFQYNESQYSNSEFLIENNTLKIGENFNDDISDPVLIKDEE